jgi:hypothetical protein
MRIDIVGFLLEEGRLMLDLIIRFLFPMITHLSLGEFLAEYMSACIVYVSLSLSNFTGIALLLCPFVLDPSMLHMLAHTPL